MDPAGAVAQAGVDPRVTGAPCRMPWTRRSPLVVAIAPGMWTMRSGGDAALPGRAGLLRTNARTGACLVRGVPKSVL